MKRTWLWEPTPVAGNVMMSVCDLMIWTGRSLELRGCQSTTYKCVPLKKNLAKAWSYRGGVVGGGRRELVGGMSESQGKRMGRLQWRAIASTYGLQTNNYYVW